MDSADGDQSLVVNNKVAPSPAAAAAVTRKAALFDFNQRRLERELRMRKDAGEID